MVTYRLQINEVLLIILSKFFNTYYYPMIDTNYFYKIKTKTFLESEIKIIIILTDF